MTKFKGYVLQRGISPHNGEPFVVIMTMESSNSKTGNMCQVWILNENIHPVAAVNLGEDVTVCGDCLHRGIWDEELQKFVDRSCYVNYGQAPAQVYKSYHRGIYGEIDDLDLKILIDRLIRWDRLVTLHLLILRLSRCSMSTPLVTQGTHINGDNHGHSGARMYFRHPVIRLQTI